MNRVVHANPLRLPGHGLPVGDPRLPRYRIRVQPEWIDGNRHMNASYYLAAIKQPAIDLHQYLDYGDDFRARSGESNFVLEAQVVYLRELLLDDLVVITARITALGEKTMTVLFELIHEKHNYLAALVEYLLVHVALGPPPRTKAIPPGLHARLHAAFIEHAQLSFPDGANRLASMKFRKTEASSGNGAGKDGAGNRA